MAGGLILLSYAIYRRDPVFVEIFLEKALVELLPEDDVEAEGRLVEHQKLGIDRHDDCQA